MSIKTLTPMFALAAAVVLAGCASNQTSESMAAKHDKEQQKLADKQKAEQETLARDQEKRETELATLKQDAAASIDRFKQTNPAIDKYFDDSAGYVVFPKVAKGGLIIGGAHGDGVVYERRKMSGDRIIGTAQISQGSIGLQIGGQTFSEIIFFQDAKALENFKKSNLEFSGTASGVAGGEGGSAEAKYENGVAIFVFNEKGLMGQASIGGQKFKFTPI